MATPRRIPTARLLIGILLHFCVPAYLLFCLAAAFMKHPAVATWGDAPGRMLWTAAWFGPGFLLAVLGAAGIGTLLDRRRPAALDAVAGSQASMAKARRMLATLHDTRIDAATARLDAQRWDHADPRHQRVAADLLAAARTFATAHNSAPPDGRPTVLGLAADSVERLADAMTSLADERRRLDEGDARTVAGYIAARYRDGAV